MGFSFGCASEMARWRVDRKFDQRTGSKRGEVEGVQEEDFTSRFSDDATPDFANDPHPAVVKPAFVPSAFL
jgi:hypothetical protein